MQNKREIFQTTDFVFKLNLATSQRMKSEDISMKVGNLIEGYVVFCMIADGGMN